MESYTFFTYSLIFLVVFIIGLSALTAFNVAILKFGKFQTKEILNNSLMIAKKFFFKESWDRFYTLVSVTKHLLYLLYAISAFLFITIIFPDIEIHHPSFIFIVGLVIILFFMVLDFSIRFITRVKTKATLKFVASISSFYILIFLILTFPILLVSIYVFKKLKNQEVVKKSFIIKGKVLEMIKDSELSQVLSSSEQRFVASFITYKEKVTREIMIPRVNVFALEANTTIKQASTLLLEENYSRIPVYEENLDNIIGVLMYKDLLKIYSDNEDLNQPIESILKPVIYAPENKKIAKLFQEFKNKKIHLAIIVNEYGGTEGIVSIEDILEELVGEIQDEYDIGEDKQFWQLPSGSIVIDAKMSIIDLENQLKIKIPHSPEYETIGGYVFHIAGTIPSKGWKIHLEDFEIEVLISNERCIEKIRITSTSSKEE